MANIKPADSSDGTTQADCLIHCKQLFNCWQYFTVLASFKLQSKGSCLIVGILLYFSSRSSAFGGLAITIPLNACCVIKSKINCDFRFCDLQIEGGKCSWSQVGKGLFQIQQKCWKIKNVLQHQRSVRKISASSRRICHHTLNFQTWSGWKISSQSFYREATLLIKILTLFIKASRAYYLHSIHHYYSIAFIF